MTTIGAAQAGQVVSTGQRRDAPAKRSTESFTHRIERDRAAGEGHAEQSARAPSSSHLAPTDSPPFMPPHLASGPTRVTEVPERGDPLQADSGPASPVAIQSLLTQTNGGGLAEGQAVWSRVFSQHFLANGYLSIVEEPGLGRTTPAPVLDVASTPPAGVQMPSALASEKAVFDAGQASAGEQPLPSLPNRTAQLPPAQECASEAEHLAKSLGPIVVADRPWADRLVRISRRDDGAATLWLRDFSLTPEQIDRIAEQVRNHAARDGLALERIMVNGRPAWTANQSQETI